MREWPNATTQHDFRREVIERGGLHPLVPKFQSPTKGASIAAKALVSEAHREGTGQARVQ